jgi:hypothetical protein
MLLLGHHTLDFKLLRRQYTLTLYGSREDCGEIAVLSRRVKAIWQLYLGGIGREEAG